MNFSSMSRMGLLAIIKKQKSSIRTLASRESYYKNREKGLSNALDKANNEIMTLKKGIEAAHSVLDTFIDKSNDEI